MTTNTLRSIWRFPIKSFGGEKLDQVKITHYGILGNKAYALFDEETEKVVNAIHHKLYPDVLKCQATFIEPPEIDKMMPPVKIVLADGTSIESTSRNIHSILSNFFERKMRFISVDVNDKSIHKNSLSLITTSTLQKLSELSPKSDFDERRFRMNLVIETHFPGFIEDSWVGKEVTISNEVNINITKPDPRCPIITLPQEGLPKDNQILKTIVDHNNIYVKGKGNRPCAGVYADIKNGGTLKIKDSVNLIQ